MYEKRFKGNEKVRKFRVRQAKRNESERRAILEAIENKLGWFKPTEIKKRLRVEYIERDRFQYFDAVAVRRSEHFPGIVPEVVNESGKYILITYLSYGSLLRLLGALQ